VRVVSWNVNSLRRRLPRVLGLLERHEPDLLCLQETKVSDDEFPHQDFHDAGWEAVVHGQRTYNGVAMVHRRGEQLEDVQRGFPGDPVPEEARVLVATFRGVRVANLYVINGQEVGSEKYERKLRWLDALQAWLAEALAPADPWLLVGDFNVAPGDEDVWDPEVWRGRIMFSEPEHERLERLMGLGLEDLYRRVHPDGRDFTWWDYRGGAFHRKHGLRIDLALGTPPVARRCRDVAVDRDERKKGAWEVGPSDHAPLVVDLED